MARLTVRFGNSRRTIVYPASADQLAKRIGAELAALSGLAGSALQEHILGLLASGAGGLAGNVSTGDIVLDVTLDAQGGFAVTAVQTHEVAALLSGASNFAPGMEQSHLLAQAFSALGGLAGDVTVGGAGAAEHFRVATATYTGNGSGQSITGIGFAPDMIFIFERDAADALIFVFDPDTGAETVWEITKTFGGHDDTVTLTGSVTSFDADGFTLGSAAEVNGSGVNYAAICFKAGSGAEVPNFDAVKFTANNTDGRVIAHSAGTMPIWVWSKQATLGAEEWLNDNGANMIGALGSAPAFDTDALMGVSASDFTIGNDIGWNFGSLVTVAYLWGGAAVTGKYVTGTYTGTGASGNAITGLGFQPGLVLIRQVNGAGLYLLSGALSPATALDLTAGTRSGGFTLDAGGFTLNATSGENASGASYRYFAWV